MTQWNWLTKPQVPYTWAFFARVIIKGLVLFAIVNIIFALINPIPALGKLSIYNTLIPGRLRLPYAENPESSYNVSLTDFNAMFASHEINSARKADDEYRVLIIGDSSVWGVLLNDDQTLSANINKQKLQLPNGKHIRAFNIGYPDQTLTKDVLFLQHAMRYQPDLILWPITLEAMAPGDQQLGSLVVRENVEDIRKLVSTYQLTSINPNDDKLNARSFFKSTLIGQRRALADMLRNQLYGITSTLSGVDQRYPRFYEPRREDFTTDVKWHDLLPQPLTENNLAFDVLSAGIKIATPTPVVFINEPIFISQGVNSDLHYNFFYPRWAYDAYRKTIADYMQRNNLPYTDFWNLVPASEFTDSAVHLTPQGSQLLASEVGKLLVQLK